MARSPKPRPVKAPKMAPKRAATGPSRNRIYATLGVALLAAVGLIVGALLLQSRNSSPRPSATPAIDFGGIPQQGAVLGSPSAKVTLIWFGDIQCPVCRAYALDVLPTVVRRYVRGGKVKTEFRGYPFIGPDSLKAERFLLAASEQDRLWPLMDAFYRNQGGENSGWLTDSLIRQLASKVPGLDVNELFRRAGSKELGRAAEQAIAEGQSIGISETPTLLVKIGRAKPYEIAVGTPDQMSQALDDALSS